MKSHGETMEDIIELTYRKPGVPRLRRVIEECGFQVYFLRHQATQTAPLLSPRTYEDIAAYMKAYCGETRDNNGRDH